jgi:hypothetical protein
LDDSSDNEFDIEEEENISMLLFAAPIRSQKLVARFLVDRSCGGNGLKATTS